MLYVTNVYRSCSFRASTSSRRTEGGSSLSLHQGLPIAAPNLDNVFGTIDRRASSAKHSDAEASSQLNISRQDMFSGSKDALSTHTNTNNSLQAINASIANVNDLTATITTTVESSVNVADDSTTVCGGETLTGSKSGPVSSTPNVESVVKNILLRKLKSDNQNFIDRLVKEIIKDALIARTVKEYYITKFSPSGTGQVTKSAITSATGAVAKNTPSSSSDVIATTKELSSNVVISRTSSANTKDTHHHRPQRSRRREERSSRSTKRSRSHSEFRGRKTPTVFVRTDGFANSTINSPIKKSVLYVSLSNLPHSKSFSYHDDTKSDSLEELIMEKVAAIENSRARKLHSKSLDHLSQQQSGQMTGKNCPSVTNANSATTVGEHTICSLGDLCDLAYEIDSEYDSVELLSNYSASRMHVDFSTDELVDLFSTTNLIDTIIRSNLSLHKPDDLDIESLIVPVKSNSLTCNDSNNSNATNICGVSGEIDSQSTDTTHDECLTLPRLVLALNLNQSSLY